MLSPSNRRSFLARLAVGVAAVVAAPRLLASAKGSYHLMFDGLRFKRSFVGDAIVHVRDFGAVADGVADDTAAIQRAIDSLPLGGGTVILCGQHCLDSEPLLIHRPTIIDGGTLTLGPTVRARMDYATTLRVVS